MKMKIFILFLVLTATAFSEQVLVVKNLSQLDGLSEIENLRVVVLPTKAIQNAFAVSSGVRIGAYPALWDTEAKFWAPAAGGIVEAQARIEEHAQQMKSGALKPAENKMIDHLRSEGILTTNDMKITGAQLNAMQDAWDALPGNSGDSKAAKYLRTLLRVQRNGGSETDVHYHFDAP